MYELDGQTFSAQDILLAARRNNMSFEDAIQKLMDQGLITEKNQLEEFYIEEAKLKGKEQQRKQQEQINIVQETLPFYPGFAQRWAAQGAKFIIRQLEGLVNSKEALEIQGRVLAGEDFDDIKKEDIFSWGSIQEFFGMDPTVDIYGFKKGSSKEDYEYNVAKLKENYEKQRKKSLAGEGRIKNFLELYPTFEDYLSSIEKDPGGLKNVITRTKEILDAYATKHYDEKTGKELNVSELLARGEIGKGLDMGVEQAIGSLMSIAMVAQNPVAGGSFLGLTEFGNSYKQNFENRPEESNANMFLNAVWKGGSEFIGNYFGGRFYRNLMGLGKNPGKKVVQESIDGQFKHLAKKTGLGFGFEGTQEMLTDISMQLADHVIFGDEKAFRDRFHQSMSTFIIGGLLGGPTSLVLGGTSKANKSVSHQFLASKKWQANQLKLQEQILKASNDLGNADETNKPFYQKRLDKLKQIYDRNIEGLDASFENLSDEELKQVGALHDANNKLYTIAVDPKNDLDVRKDAELEIKQNLFYLESILGSEFDAKIEETVGRTMKAAEVIRKRQKGFGFNRKNLNVVTLRTQEQIDEALKNSPEAKSADGIFIGKDKSGKSTIYINEQVASITEATNVLGHEFLHYIVSRAFKTDRASLLPGVKALRDYLADNNPEALKTLERKIATKYGVKNKDGVRVLKKDKDGIVLTERAEDIEEYFTVTSELIDKKLIDTKASADGLINGMRSTLRGLGFGSVDFRDGKQVFDFLVDYQKNITKSGLLGRIISRRLAKVNLTGLEAADGADGRLKLSTEAQKTIDDIAKKEDGQAMTKAEYDAEGAINAYDYLISKKNIDGVVITNLVRKGVDVKADNANVKGEPLDLFLERVREKLIPDVFGFDPRLETTSEGKFGLSGHINSRVNYRVGDVFGKVAKEVKPTASLDEQVGDQGRTYAETIADTQQDARLQALEEQNLSPGALETDIVEEGQKSVYRTKLKNAKGQALIQKQQENDIREAVRSIVKSIDTTIDEDKFMLTFENAVKKQMKNIVQQAIGSGSDFRTFLTNGNFETIIDFSTIQDLVAMERLVGQKFPDGKRIFSVIVKKNISPTEVDKAIQQGKIKPDVSRDSGPDLYEKRIPTNEELEAFFLGKTSTGKTMQEVLNYTIGRSTLGTRKDGLSRMIVTELAQDAALETLQEPNTLQDAVILSENAAVEVQVATLARKLNRPVDLKFSKSIEDIKKLDDVYQQVNSIQKIYNQKGFDSKLANEIRNTVELEEAAGIANQNFVNRIYELFWQVKSIPEVKQKLKELRRKHPEMKVHKMFEKIVINNAAKVFDKMDNIKSSLRTPTEKGAAQDLILTATNDVLKAMKVGIEVKGTTARNTSTSFLFDLEVLSFPQGKSEASFEENGMQPINDLFNRAKEAGILEDLKTILEVFPEGLNITKSGDIEITEQQWEAVSNSGIRAKLSRLLGEVTPSWVAETYLRKKNPSQYINMGVSGLFSFDNVLNADVTKFQDLDMKIPLTMRLVRSGNKLRLRVEAQLDSRNFPRQKTNLYAEQGMQDFANSMKFSKSKTSALNNNIVNDAFNAARTTTENTPVKGISIFDFDETVGISENFVIATKDGKTIRVASDEWPHVGEQLAADGWTFDFSDFNKVTKGRPGPLMQKLKNQIKKYGAKDVYILTARASASEKAIHDWLKSQGINLPIENITGLGNSTGEAKAMWILDKYANQGYNDIYFVDDAIPNVEAVKVVLDQLDVKSKSVQAKMKFSKSLSADFNKIIEQNKGVNAEKIFSDVSAKKLGARPGGLRFFIPPSADDFLGLLRYFAGKGKKGEADMAFFKKALIDPFARGYIEMNSAKMAILNDFKALRKQYPKVKKQLGKLIPESAFTYDNAIRVYLFNEAGFDIPGISDAEVAELSQIVKNDADLLAFAEGLSAASRAKEGYLKPSESWVAENIAMDMQDAATKINRTKYLEEWQQNADEIFSKDNLNKIQAVYGSDVRSAFEDMLYRMKTGQNRPSGSNKIANQFMNWINNSVGAIMFFNARSAVLQTISTVNFLNFEGNNIFSAAAMFANQKQYWSDFKTLMNSDYLKARRAGLSMNINEAELANAVAGAKNKATAALRYLLNLGFTPTQIADSFAIAAGGATFYRSKIKKYLKEGMSQAEAEKQAFQDFQEIAEETQQSARPDKLSQQQTSVIGRIVLNFANTPMQMARLMKKAAQDLAAGRGDWRSNVSRILYYGAVQNIIFASLQNAIFALTFDEEDDEKILEKSERIFNGALDSLLRGTGIYGAVASTIKNTIIRFLAEREKKSRADYGNVIVEAINLSPSIGSKFRKIYSALKTDKYNRKVYDYMGYDNLENPVYQAITSGVEGTTNIPVNRLLRKIDNMKEVFNDKNTAIQRIFVGLGWDQWSLGIDPYKEVKEAKEKMKGASDKVPQIPRSANPRQCRKRKSDGTRCKIMTRSKSQFCHYHD